ncbi:MAG: hypothetical protein ABEJ98_00735 [Candidatus Nanohaloarchaea archaeon]
MPDQEDCTFEIFDSSVFVEAIADTSGRKEEAREAIYNVKTADNRIPISHELIIGEVKDFFRDSDSWGDDVDRQRAERKFEEMIEDFKFVKIDLEEYKEELTYLIEEKTRIASEFNDALIVAIGLSIDEITKIHTTDDWSLRDRNIDINSI